jgi:long-chain acyl-CoA synthetase
VQLCIEVGEDFVGQPLVREMVAEAVKAANQQLEGFEQIKHYEIIRSRFTEENGELTPTLKAKKHVLLKHYHDLIEELYQRKK